MFELKSMSFYKLAILGIVMTGSNMLFANTSIPTLANHSVTIPLNNTHQPETITHKTEAETLLTNSQIIDLATQQSLTPQQFLEKLASQDYVILGEYHDNKAQHQLAYWLLDSLNQQRPQGSLLLEMLTVDQQPLVNKATQNPPQNLEQLSKALNWQSSWDWDLYGKIVQHPIHHHYSLVATNLTKPEVSTLMQGAEPIKGYDSTTPAIKATIRNSILDNHHLDNASDEDMVIVNRMVEIQQFRDRRMAEKILSAPSPSLLLTGNFHAQKSVGVPIHLSDLQYNQSNPKQGVIVMMVSKTDDLSTDDADYAWVIDAD
ncbi:ChaN family lipoprotein [Psychrobacter sp. I-STPA6b]|uniref:ChaN family lipoprotein n=1 Tax=Psychrobacter sp. I-STPA6b TaxID=2585718 RepID=UPI001D0CB346|nr:ChaN family lipoprotein [Psychrobacter sp. I-STPA6b]